MPYNKKGDLRDFQRKTAEKDKKNTALSRVNNTHPVSDALINRQAEKLGRICCQIQDYSIPALF
ncbi:MAG TPA: hypothetical protein O0X45_01205, partial [Methanocorpusculum sp.]|nr:hypothetical protein [Methanocorpusculum sp.]